jgi:hypothetical protein
MPPLVTITADARNSNFPNAFRDEGTPRGSVEGSSTIPQLTREDVDQGGPGAPGDVEPGYRVAVSLSVVAAALGPPHHRKDFQTAVTQPAALLSGREVHVGVRPLPWPVVLFPVESRCAQPVLQRKLVAIPNAQPTLFGAVDKEQTPERPEGLPTKVGAVLLVEDEDAQAAVHQFAGGHQTG